MNVSLLEKALILVRAGEVIGFPTETFYGLGADPRNPAAVDALISLKDRPEEAGIPLIIDSVRRIEEWIAPEESAVRAKREELIKNFWPGPLTLVIAVREELRKELAPPLFGPDRSLAVRLSPAPEATALAKGLGGAVTATSANPRGKPPAMNAFDARAYFPHLHILESASSPESSRTRNVAKPSTLLDVRSIPFQILREGAVQNDVLAPWI